MLINASTDKTLRTILLSFITVILICYAIQAKNIFASIHAGMQSVVRAEQLPYIQYNNETIGHASRLIGEQTGVEQVAIIADKGHLLIGIRVEDAYEYKKPSIYSSSARICHSVLDRYKNSKTAITVNDELSEKIIELSLYIDKGVEKPTLSQRFEYLYSQIKNE